jgi:hypothetical protein
MYDGGAGAFQLRALDYTSPRVKASAQVTATGDRRHVPSTAASCHCLS